jgi:hypothetical protein
MKTCYERLRVVRVKCIVYAECWLVPSIVCYNQQVIAEPDGQISIAIPVCVRTALEIVRRA